MKMSNGPLLMQKRRHFLIALLTSPLLLYAHSSGRKNSFPAMEIKDSGRFIIMNGWVMLKQDLTEDIG